MAAILPEVRLGAKVPQAPKLAAINKLGDFKSMNKRSYSVPKR